MANQKEIDKFLKGRGIYDTAITENEAVRDIVETLLDEQEEAAETIDGKDERIKELEDEIKDHVCMED